MSLPKAYDPKVAEDKWYSFWEGGGYLRATVNPKKPPFAIVIPPPNITGELHIGHALNNTLQDIIIRYKRMDGFEACWFPGIDHASIAVHVVIERGLAQRELDDLLQQINYSAPKRPITRQDLGRENFIKLGWAWKEKYGKYIREQLKALGCSCDWERERFTMDEGLSNAVKEVFIRLYEEGFIYRGERLINWCPRCLTSLSDLEVEHEEHQGQLYYIKYPLAEDAGRFIKVATTRPETMLGDTAVAVHPKDRRYKKLVGKKAILPLMDREIPIIADESVDPKFGTGAVKVTPAHDFADFELGQRHKLAQISIFNKDATLNANAGPYAGLERYACRERVVDDLKALGLLEKIERYTHSLGRCQRCHEVVEPMLSSQWFMRMDELAKPAIEAVKNGDIVFIPKRWEKVYFDWMRNIKDWCISRQLWWGHRIPAWHCLECKEITVSRGVPNECKACGSKNIKQDEDVLDTWFSSALWPFSIMGWPKMSPELAYFYPTQLLSTGPDIIFFWVARMIMMGLHFMKKIPFEKVFFHPIIVDEHGQKMSKSKGNVLDPMGLKEKYGMDAVRFALAGACSERVEVAFSERDVEGARKFLNKIWNAARFAITNLKGFQNTEAAGLSLQLEDRWIISKLNRLMESTRAHLENYEFNLAAKELYNFVWHDFCDWYLEIIKPRLYTVSKSASSQVDKSKESAQYVLLKVLKNILKLLHPFMPFITEEIWQRLPQKDSSVMIAPFPKPDTKLIDKEAEQAMQRLQQLITAIRTIRSELNVPPNRRAKVLIRAEDQGTRQLALAHKSLFAQLAKVEGLSVVGGDVERPAAPRMILDFAEIFVHLEGLIDLRKEGLRLRKELKETKKELESTLRKLNNEEFLKKAPPQIIEKERNKLEGFKEKVERIEQNLKILGV